MYELKLRDSLLIMFRFSYTFVFIKLKLFVRAQLFVGSFAQKKYLNFYNGNYYAQGHRTHSLFWDSQSWILDLQFYSCMSPRAHYVFFLDGSLLSSSVLVSLFRISYPDLLLTKPKARSGQIRFVHVIACQERDRQ